MLAGNVNSDRDGSDLSLLHRERFSNTGVGEHKPRKSHGRVKGLSHKKVVIKRGSGSGKNECTLRSEETL